MTTTLVVDGNNVAMRAIFAMNRSGLSSAAGIPTGPLLVFINTLARHVTEEAPDRLAVCWDGGRSQRRIAIDAGYKANRAIAPESVDQYKRGTFALAKRFLSVAGIHHVERPGMEADDLIAHYWRRYVECREPGDRMVILSSDKDFLMLMQEGVEQVRLSSSGTPTDRWDADRVQEVYGCPAWAMRYVLALAGDTSDGVPGLPRVGVKTAVKMLAKYDYRWSDLVDSLDEERAARAGANLKLVDLRSAYEETTLPGVVPPFHPTSMMSPALAPLFDFLTELDLRSVRDRLVSGHLWGPQGA